MKKMKLVIILLLFTISINVSASDKNKIKVPVFGEIPFVQEGDLYSLNLGKMGKFNFSGTIDPLSLSTSVGMDDLKLFPGSKVLAVLGLQDIELSFSREDFQIAANIDDKFKDEIVDKVKEIKVIAPVMDKVFGTLEIRSSRASLTYDMSMQLLGELDLNIFVFGNRLPIPKITGNIEPEKILSTIASKIEDVAKNEIAKIGKEVVNVASAAANASINTAKAGYDMLGYYATHTAEWKDHFTHGNDCFSKCVPNRAKKLYTPVYETSNQAVRDFYNQLGPKIAKIEGQSLRETFIKPDWNRLISSIDNNWENIIKDQLYKGFDKDQGDVEKLGVRYRELVRAKKQEHVNYRNELWNKLMNDKKFTGPLDNYTTNVNLNAQLRLRNYWKKTFINIEPGSPICGEIAPGWLSAKWTFERVDGNRTVRIKNGWKGTYLHIEHGRLECTPIGGGAHSAMWIIEDIPGTNVVRIRNKWKNTEYLHIERGKLECTQIGLGWLSARWELGYIR